MNQENIDYVNKIFNMNLEVKSLLYKASCDPVNRKELVKKASEIIDSFYNLPKGYIKEELEDES